MMEAGHSPSSLVWLGAGQPAASPGQDGAGAVRWRCRLHHLRIDVHADNPATLCRVRAALGSVELLPVEAPAAPPEIVLRVSTRPWTAARPRRARVVAEQCGIRTWRAGDEIELECAGHTSCLDLGAGTADVVLPASSPEPRQDLVIYTLLLLLGRRGLYGLHASAVARDGAGCLFVGAGGSGKSTQTYSLVRQGWGYLGDDSLLLRPCAGAVEAMALRRDLCLHPSAALAFPEVAVHGKAGPLAGKGKRQLAMRALHPDRLIDGCIPRLLVFPEIFLDAPSRLVPLDRADALVRLLEQSAAVVRGVDDDVLLPLDPVGVASHVDTLGRLARQARGYRLLAGRDLLEKPERLAALLSEVMEAEPAAAPAAA